MNLKQPINIPRTLMKKVDSIQDQMGTVSTDTKALRKNKKKVLEIRNNRTEIKNSFNGLMDRRDSHSS